MNERRKEVMNPSVNKCINSHLLWSTLPVNSSMKYCKYWCLNTDMGEWMVTYIIFPVEHWASHTATYILLTAVVQRILCPELPFPWHLHWKEGPNKDENGYMENLFILPGTPSWAATKKTDTSTRTAQSPSHQKTKTRALNEVELDCGDEEARSKLSWK